MFKDRLIRGAVAGVIAALYHLIWNLSSQYLFHFARVTWFESMSQVIAGHSITSTMDFIVSTGYLLIWNGFLGALFIRFVIPDRDGSYIGRAIGFSFIAWFFLQAIGTMHHVKTLDNVAWQTILSNWIDVIIFGVVLGRLTQKWDQREAKKR